MCHSLALGAIGLAACQFNPAPILSAIDSAVSGEVDADVRRDGDALMPTPDAAGGQADSPAPDAFPDAAGPICLSGPCVAAGGMCNAAGDRCQITRTTTGSVVCPDGLFCEVHCTGPEACRSGGIDCSAAAGCDLTCDGANACQEGAVACGPGPCVVRCLGDNACKDVGVDCGVSTCEVTCNGANACEAGIACMPAAECTSHCCGANACLGTTCGCAEDSGCS